MKFGKSLLLGRCTGTLSGRAVFDTRNGACSLNGSVQNYNTDGHERFLQTALASGARPKPGLEKAGQARLSGFLARLTGKMWPA